MATRSAIAVKHGDVFKAVYCHWDGYLEHNGQILQDHYDSVKANNLVALGDVSSLRPEIGEQHAFSRLDTEMSEDEYDKLYGDMTTFYGRDRGEENTGHKVCHSYQEFLERFENSWCEYFYVMDQGIWYYSTRSNTQLKRLDQALNKEAA